jgi:hypothetical protein
MWTILHELLVLTATFKLFAGGAAVQQKCVILREKAGERKIIFSQICAPVRKIDATTRRNAMNGTRQVPKTARHFAA